MTIPGTTATSAADARGPARVARFNRACLLVAAAWLLVGVPLTVKFRPMRAKDFPQFYMGGVIARHGAWDALYPVPHPDSPYNPGLKNDSAMRPRYAQLAAKYRVATGDEPRFIQPPPAALLFRPLVWLPYDLAYVAWAALMGAMCLAVAHLAGRFHERCAGRPSRVSGGLVLLICCSHLTYYVIRTTNIEMLMALSIALATLALLTPARPGGAATFGGVAALVVGGIVKYATAVLLPLAVAMRRWALVGWTAAAGLALLAVAVAVMGTGPFITFLADVFPRLSRPYDIDGNQSLKGMIIYHSGVFPLPAAVNAAVRVAMGAMLAALLALIFTRDREAWRRPEHVCAGAAALVAWLLIFSPLTWDKYYTYLFPFYGWLAWEAARSRGRALVVGGVFASLFAAWFNVGDFLPAPLTFHMLLATVAVLALAARRLWAAPCCRACARGIPRATTTRAAAFGLIGELAPLASQVESAALL